MPISNSNPDLEKATQQQDSISSTFHKSRKDTSLLVLCSSGANQSTLNLRQLMLVDCIQLAISHPISVDDHLLWQSLLLLVECTQAGWKCPTQLPPSPATKYYIQLKQPKTTKYYIQLKQTTNVRGYTFIIFFLFPTRTYGHVSEMVSNILVSAPPSLEKWSKHFALVNTTKKDWWYYSRV